MNKLVIGIVIAAVIAGIFFFAFDKDVELAPSAKTAKKTAAINTDTTNTKPASEAFAGVSSTVITADKFVFFADASGSESNSAAAIEFKKYLGAQSGPTDS